MAELTGQTFAGCEIISELGRGGMGAVYKARQPLLNRIVALKVMAEQISSDPDYVARFIREAASAANLRHPNIVEVFTAGEQNGMYFMVMEFVEGESLRKRLDRLGRIPPQEAVAVAIYVAQALQHAWNKTRLIHRDIKPDNIFLSTAGEVKVGDLGLAKNVGSENTELTQSGMMMGSPHYISPEQAQAAKDIDFRTDIYSLGCTLYHMLTGKTPYTGDSSMVVIMKHVHEPPPAIFKAWPQCPTTLGMLVGKMLAKDRAARPQSYEQLLAELFAVSEKLQQSAAAPKPVSVTSSAAVTQVLASSTAPTVALQPSAKPKNLKVICVAASAAAVVVLGGLLLWSPWKTAPPQDSTTPSLQYSAASSDAALKQLGSVFTNAVGAEMVYIPPGEFMLGSTKEERAWAMANGWPENVLKREGEQPRKTTIRQGFWMGRTEVTVGQWKKFVSETHYMTDGEKKGESSVVQKPGNRLVDVKGASWKNPHFGFRLEDNHPVCCVSWNDAAAFCRWLTDQERRARRLPQGCEVRLPTEAEWEYACRAGSQDKCWWGDNPDDGTGRLNWDGKEDGFEYVAPVDSFGARGRNRFGLADMLGNVFEWCLDGYDPTQAHTDAWADNTNARVLRGGAFDMRHESCRCAWRHSGSPSSSGCTRGFRIVVASAVFCQKSSTPPASPAPASQGMNDTFSQNAINLLPLIDPQRDAVEGIWTLAGGELRVAGSDYARLQIPYQPPAEYDFRIIFTRQQGGDAIWQILTGGGHTFRYCLDGWNGLWFGFDMIGNKQARENPCGVRMKRALENGRRYTSLVQVRNDGVKGSLDAHFVTEWKTNYQDMSLQGNMQMRDEQSLGVGVHRSAVVFHRIEVCEVTGKGTFTRGAPADTQTPSAINNWQDVMPTVRAEMDKSHAARHEDGWAVHTQARTSVINICDRQMGDVAVRGRFRNNIEIGLASCGPPSKSYLFKLKRGGGTLQLRRYVNNTHIEDQPLANLQYPSADEHDFLITKVGDLLSASVDGAFAGSARDSTLPSGTVRMCLLYSDDAIRDLSIADLSTFAPATADAGWQNAINLLPLIDPEKDAVNGLWVIKNGELAVEPKQNVNTPRIEIPYQPPSEYDFRVVFSSQEDTPHIVQILSHQARAFEWVIQIAGDRFGFQKVHDKLVGLDNPASLRQSEKLKSGVHYTSLVEVRTDMVRGFLDGRLIREWKTDFTEMSPSAHWRLRDTSLLGVACEGKPVFHRIEVREVTGKGRFTRGATATNITHQ